MKSILKNALDRQPLGQSPLPPAPPSPHDNIRGAEVLPGTGAGAGRRKVSAVCRRSRFHACQRLTRRGTASWRAPWGFSGDVAEAVRLAVEKESATGEIYNVGESGGLDVESWIRELGVAAGWKRRVVNN